jgi:hypothetical protein
MGGGRKGSFGPYQPGEEQRFKRDAIELWQAEWGPGWSFFCIESPGVADGFPDVLAANSLGEHRLYEFKVSDKSGAVVFEKTQLLFYKAHPDLNIKIVAWDVPGGRMAVLDPPAVMAGKSTRFKLPRGRGGEDAEGGDMTANRIVRLLARGMQAARARLARRDETRREEHKSGLLSIYSDLEDALYALYGDIQLKQLQKTVRDAGDIIALASMAVEAAEALQEAAQKEGQGGSGPA